MSLDSGSSQSFDTGILDYVSDGVLVLDEERTVTYCNDTAAEILGSTREELVEQNVNAVFGQDSLERIAAITTGESADSFRQDIEGSSNTLVLTVCPDGTQTVVFVREESGKGEEERAISEERASAEDRTGATDREEHSAMGASRENSAIGVSKETGAMGADRETVLQELHNVASNLAYSRDEKIQQMLSIAARYLGVNYGFLTRVENDTQEILYSVGDHPELTIGATAPLSETYCQYTLETGGTKVVEIAHEEGWEDEPAYRRFNLECYLGVVLTVDGEEFGTVCFVDTVAREGGFDQHDQTLIELLADWLTLMLERQAYERELEHQQAFTESLLNSLPDPVYAFDGDGQLLRWNDRLEGVTGYTGAELDGVDPHHFVAEGDRKQVTEAFQSALNGVPVSVEASLETKTGGQIPYEFSAAPLYDKSGEIIGITGVGRDITEQNTHRERLSRILETTRSLMQARDRQHVGELAANAATELLDEEFSVFRLYDAEAGTLEPIAGTERVEAALGERPTYAVGEGYPGTVFASGEPEIVSDFETVDNGFEYGEARSAMYYPVGVHGTITVASPEPNAFDETDQHVLALLATSAAAACMRAKRMQEIREAREHTERILDRVNGLVQNTIEVLVQARTREELESGVVSELASTDPYTFAWLGQPDVATEKLVPTAWDGEAALPIEGCSFNLTQSGEPVAKAFTEGEIQVLTNLDELYGPLRDVVEHSDVETLVVIPLAYKDTMYGVLTVCADDSDVFDERERIVLEALGRAVANAINAVERGRILDATEIIELEFAVDSPDLLFNRLSSGTDSRIESVGTDYRSDGSVRLYLSVEDVDPTAFADRVRDDPEVLEFTTIVEHESECLVELVVEESLLAVLAEYGAATRAVVSENGSTRVTVELPYEAEARELFELVENRYPGTDLLGYHERERPVETRQDFRASLSDRLTDRQETALRTAYLGGFFDWPREVDGNELAEAMNIARPTYHQHLRAAQAKVFEELFE